MKIGDKGLFESEKVMRHRLEADFDDKKHGCHKTSEILLPYQTQQRRYDAIKILQIKNFLKDNSSW